MSKLQQIKERAAEIAAGRRRGRIDQEQARIERAKQEARREAREDAAQSFDEQFSGIDIGAGDVALGDDGGSGAAPGAGPIDPADFGFGGDDGGFFGSDR